MTAMGRPREFDIDKALEQALHLFWRKGYEGTSIADLTEAIGITKPSLYAAFGNKEELFRKAFDRYVDGPGGYVQVALANRPRARSCNIFSTKPRTPSPSGAAGLSRRARRAVLRHTAETIKQELMARRAKGEDDLRKRFEQAVAQGDLSKETNPLDLARYISAIVQGMAVQAIRGAGRDDLRRIADITLRNWPPN